MTHVLYIEASPRKNRSASSEIARAALCAWQAADDSLTLDTLDVWSTELPEFDGPVMEAKYAGIVGCSLTPKQSAAWSQIRLIADRFLAADVLVLAVPMWNFSVPYKLKHLIDVISQKDVLFTFDEHGFGGLLRGRKALLICARGLDYAPNGSVPARVYDFQKPYLEAWLRFIGVSNIWTVVAEKTLYDPDIDLTARARGCDQAMVAVQELRLSDVDARVVENVGGSSRVPQSPNELQ